MTARWRVPIWGRFRTARARRQSLPPVITLFIPGTPPANHPPYRSVHGPFKTASGVQNSGPWDPWLSAVENSRLFAQRGHSARTAHGAPPLGPWMSQTRRTSLASLGCGLWSMQHIADVPWVLLLRSGCTPPLTPPPQPPLSQHGPGSGPGGKSAETRARGVWTGLCYRAARTTEHTLQT